MAHIRVKKGLDIPLERRPLGFKGQLASSGQVALELRAFSHLRLKSSKKIGDKVHAGEPIVHDKLHSGCKFVSPATGVIRELRYGYKRALDAVVIERKGEESFFEHPKISSSNSPEQVVSLLGEWGFLPHIIQRPFGGPPSVDRLPSHIFIQAAESAPLIPSSDEQLNGKESYFHAGAELLLKVSKEVHLVSRKNCKCKAALHSLEVQQHTIEGVHPLGNPSVAIQKVARVRSERDVIWTLRVNDVIVLGMLALEGIYHTHKVVTVAGPCVPDHLIGLYEVGRGDKVSHLLQGASITSDMRCISGSPLVGLERSESDFLCFHDYALSLFPEPNSQKMFHFLRASSKDFSFSRAYLSSNRNGRFSTNQHGEERAFIDGAIYERVMPLKVPAMQLVKATLAEDYESMKILGILEVLPEDFALPAFICPSKIEMVQIIAEGIQKYRDQMI